MRGMEDHKSLHGVLLYMSFLKISIYFSKMVMDVNTNLDVSDIIPTATTIGQEGMNDLACIPLFVLLALVSFVIIKWTQKRYVIICYYP